MGATVIPGGTRSLAILILAFAVLAIGQGPVRATVRSICDDVVCEEISHSGGTVDRWRGQVYAGTSWQCETAYFWVNGGVIDSAQVCGSGWVSAYANTPYNLSSGSRLCVSFANEPGYPCITL